MGAIEPTRVVPGMTLRSLLLLAQALAAAACAPYPVEGDFVGRPLNGHENLARTIVVIHNHGFSRAQAGTYRPVTPPILSLATARNPDVVVFSQVRNLTNPTEADHAAFIEAGVAYFHTERGVPIENIILAGQSCGGWGSLHAAAYRYPTIGGVLAFAPTCHGKLPHPPAVRARRAWELAQLADRLRAQGTIFLYEGDSYYDVQEWDRFAARATDRAPWLQIVRVSRPRVRELCDACGRDSHGAYWDGRFAAAFFEDHVQTLIDGVRARIRAGLPAPAD
jgi:dienelactone hydrolase